MLNGNEQISLGSLDASIERGLDFLQRSQLPTGEFKVYMSTDHMLEKDCVVDSSPFPTALIAYSLGFSDSPKTRAILARVMQFFLAEMEGPGLWRYWTRKHRYHDNIPPDLDDIACVSSVLRQHSIAFPTNLNLIMANRNQQGLFYTWLTPRWPMPLNFAYWRVAARQWLNPLKLHYFWKLNESAPNDVDCIVNANVLFYVGESLKTQAVIDYLINIVWRREEACCDKWHLNRFTFYYAISRNFHSGVRAFSIVRDEVVDRIISAANDDGSIGDNVQDTALAICALLNWNSLVPELIRAVRFLLATQRPSGYWPRAVLYYGGPKKYYGWGSEDLTTGFCAEAMLRYRETLAWQNI
jgi:hypothetical protein